MEAKKFCDCVASTLAEVEVGILVNILSDVEKEILVDTHAKTVAEVLANTRGDVKTKRVVYKQVNMLTTARRES